MPKQSARKKRNSSSSRKSASEKKKIRQTQIKQILVVASLFLMSGVFLSGYLFYKKITQEYASAFSVSSRDILSNDLFTTVFIAVDDFEAEPLLVKELSLYVFDRSTLKTVIYEIPVDVVIDVPGRFSEEPLSNVLALSMMGNGTLTEGGQIMSQSVFKLLAFPVDRYILVESGAESATKSLFSGKLEVTSNADLIKLKEMISTDLSLRELFNIYKFTSSLPQDRILHTQIGETYLSNPSILDEELMDLTFDLALSRVIRNFGGRVVATGNTDESYENSLLIVDDPTSESTRIISEIFGINNIILYSDIEGFSESEINRSDITIILGLDFAGLL